MMHKTLDTIAEGWIVILVVMLSPFWLPLWIVGKGWESAYKLWIEWEEHHDNNK